MNHARSYKHYLLIALFAGLGACAHKIDKAEMPTTAVPSDEVARLEADINAGYAQQYDVLDNDDFAQAQKYLRRAKEQMSDSKPQEKILDSVAYGRSYLQRTKEISEGRQGNVQGILDARQAAIQAGARDYPLQTDRLKALDDRLRDTTDDRKLSSARFNELQSSYLDLELAAIQAAQLDKARAKVAGARRDGAEDNTPKTLHQADLDITNAQNVIAANRHNADAYRDAVSKANESADLVVDVLAASKRGGSTLSESAALDMVRQNRQITNLKGQLNQSESERRALATEVDRTQGQLSEAEKNQAIDTAMANARKNFNSSEAEVFRDGDKLLIRLKAMAFPTGKSDLPQSSLDLLAKVKGVAEDLHPQQIVVAGHTDSTGNAGMNQSLSQERAQAVAKYFESNGMEGDRIQAVGEGYSKPIASNKTRAGRAQNRRVDVIITPGAVSKQ